MDDAIRIPRDKAARDRLFQMAGLTEEERHAVNQWCAEQAEENRRRQRRGLERLADTPMADGTLTLDCGHVDNGDGVWPSDAGTQCHPCWEADCDRTWWAAIRAVALEGPDTGGSHPIKENP